LRINDAAPDTFSGIVGKTRIRHQKARGQLVAGDGIDRLDQLAGRIGGFHGQLFVRDVPRRKRHHAAAATESVRRIPGGPEGMIRRIHLAVHGRVSGTRPLVVDSAVLPVGPPVPDGLHLFVAAHAVGRLNVCAEDVVDAPGAPARPAALFKDGGAVFFEIGKRCALVNGLLHGGHDGGQFIAFGNAGYGKGASFGFIG